MAIVAWDTLYETGIPSIDRQHQDLFDALNRLYDAISSGQGEAQIAQTLGFLVDYTVTHFRDEEAQMASVDFPGLVDHQAEHARLLHQVAEALATYQADPVAAKAEGLALFLVQWVVRHIHEMDQQFAELMKARGVK